jgi:hypothetical protein
MKMVSLLWQYFWIRLVPARQDRGNNPVKGGETTAIKDGDDIPINFTHENDQNTNLIPMLFHFLFPGGGPG